MIIKVETFGKNHYQITQSRVTKEELGLLEREYTILSIKGSDEYTVAYVKLSEESIIDLAKDIEYIKGGDPYVSSIEKMPDQWVAYYDKVTVYRASISFITKMEKIAAPICIERYIDGTLTAIFKMHNKHSYTEIINIVGEN